jgi:uncharacterized protein YfeS
MEFLEGLLDDWGLEVPAKMISSVKAREKWLDEDDMHETYLLGECRARVASAFGQLKITGKMDSGIHKEASTSIECMLWMNQRATARYPDWEHAADERAKFEKMKAMLEKVKHE